MSGSGQLSTNDSSWGVLACPRCGASYPYHKEATHCSQDGARLLRFEQDPLIGTLMEHNLILRVIADGGLGRVYRAGNIFLERLVAVKVLFGHLAADPVLRERFRREAQAAGSLRHPNIVSVFDFGSTPRGLVFMVMEYLGGYTLGHYLRAGRRFTARESLSLVRQIARGLGAAHRLGFIHRDLKPDNVMIVQNAGKSVAKILDFGLVAESSSPPRDRLTLPGLLVGTPEYMAPERVLGAPGDQRSDLYALGVILYEMLAGRPLFSAHGMDSARAHAALTPAPLPRAGALGKVAFWLLEKEPDRRPENAEALIEILDRLELELEEGVLPAVPSDRRSSAAAVAAHETRRPKPARPKTEAARFDLVESARNMRVVLGQKLAGAR